MDSTTAMRVGDPIRLSKCPQCSEGWVMPDPDGFEDWGICDMCSAEIDINVDLWSRVVDGEGLAWVPVGHSPLLCVVKA